MKCPNCRLENPDSAQRCDCGYDFQAMAMKQSYAEQDRLRRAPPLAEQVRRGGRRDMLMGGVVFVIGLIVTLATYAGASQGGGGRYVVAYGAIIGGIVQFFRGVARSR